MISPRARPPPAKGAGLIDPFPWNPGPATLAHGLHCTAGTPKPCTGGCSRRLIAPEAPSPECGRECQGTGDCGPAQHVGAGLWGLLLANSSRAARATTPGPPPQPHGWVRLGFEVSRFPDFGGDGMHQPPQGCGVWGSLAPLFSPHP